MADTATARRAASAEGLSQYGPRRLPPRSRRVVLKVAARAYGEPASHPGTPDHPAVLVGHHGLDRRGADVDTGHQGAAKAA